MELEPHLEGLLRELAPRTLAALTRRYGHFDLAEEAVQEALLAAATSWSGDRMPDAPAAWLTTVATRRLTDLLRSEQARRRREQTEALRTLPLSYPSPPDPGEQDDSLVLLFLCCHPALTPPAQVALTLRAVGGLSTAEIARALLLPESTITRRISRAKQSILEAGGRFALPDPAERARRLDVVLHVIYLIFTEGHTATAGDALVRGDLCAEAIRLGRLAYRLLPEEPEVGGLLAQMLLTDARRDSRTGPDGQLVPLAEQDRSRWNREMITEGTALVTASLSRRRPGPYQLQAAINAVHAEAGSYEETDWPQILALYGVLDRLADDPVVTLNRAVALAQVQGPTAALELLETVAADPRLAGHHRVHAVRAHLLRAAGRPAEAADQYRAAARRTLSTPERRYLLRQAALVAEGTGAD
ncbi:sigma-70 family RNA polymerase sigma factor [Actinoplanes sp. NPDC051633]|uniref:RNA polymerase sigma factor n=1 Tax=Actinoplanes sp. NPDC051633 TaxID=3155670 RepID=UPI00342A49A7